MQHMEWYAVQVQLLVENTKFRTKLFLLKCTCNVSDQKGKKKKKTCNVESYIPKCMAS